VRVLVVSCQSWLVEILLCDLDSQATDSHLETQRGRGVIAQAGIKFKVTRRN